MSQETHNDLVEIPMGGHLALQDVSDGLEVDAQNRAHLQPVPKRWKER